ncbi:peptidase m20 [Lucifera butyrica]|uniref:Peptidase m20 n=1 Tax=Lucifera butyrica TaxID=1351585 RepID=A0A498RDQ1_9FIRM|nr:Sapep family Mn(2+)-dependent dipeptidase [Lucifera butyrica]VBB09601.1 peptidase m20 [Lucifera butyrica]
MINFAATAEKYRQELVILLEQWVRIPSVYDKETVTAEMPFGAGVAQALGWFENLGREAGFAAKSVDGYAVHAEYGTGQEYVYAFGHCDVVPAGEGWQSGPFRLVKSGDRLTGRGVIDDKGPLLAVFLALKLIRDKALPLKRRIRVVAGGNEESGFQCIRHYFRREPKPAYGFTPDAKFPVIHGEKGGVVLQITGPVANPALYIAGGEVHNTIPDSVVVKNCWVAKETLEPFLAAENLTWEAVREEGRVAGFKLTGLGGHSSKPENANNPLEKVFTLLPQVLKEKWLEDLAPLLNGGSRDGRIFGLTAQGRCGSMTLVTTVLRLEGGRFRATLSIRYPENVTLEEIRDKVGAYFQQHGLAGYEVKTIGNKRPHYMEPDSLLVRTLHGIYIKHTGDTASPVRVTSAGTYAAEMENSVIFGGEFPDGSAGNAHQAGEYGSEDAFVKAIGIYAEALWTLGNL